MVRERYLKHLEMLKDSVLSFGNLADVIFSDSIVAVIDLDIKMAEKVFAYEAKVNEFEDEIEISILDLLALQQPIASDLRLIISSLKISADLKRINRTINKYCKNSQKNRGRPYKTSCRFEKNGRDYSIHASEFPQGFRDA